NVCPNSHSQTRFPYPIANSFYRMLLAFPRPRVPLWILASALAFWAANGRAALNPAKALTQYTQQVWAADAGLPQNSVLALAQTPDGYLWIATEEGLARFDGVRFTVFNKATTPELETDSISSLLVDREGTLWIGTNGGGLTRYRNSSFHTYNTRNGLSNDTITSLYEDAAGALWIGTDGGGLDRFQNGKFRAYTTRDGLPDNAVFSICRAKEGGLWIGTHSGLAHFENGAFRTYTKADGLRDSYVKVALLDRQGVLWIGTNSGGLSRFADGRFTNYSETYNGLSSNNIWSLLEDSAG